MIVLTLPQKLSKRTTSEPIRHSTATVLAIFVSCTLILKPSLISPSVVSCGFRRAARDHTFPATAPTPQLPSHLQSVVCSSNRPRWIRGMVNTLANGALITYRGVFGVKCRSENADVQDTSYHYRMPQTIPLVVCTAERTTQLPNVSLSPALTQRAHNSQPLSTSATRVYMMFFQYLHKG